MRFLSKIILSRKLKAELFVKCRPTNEHKSHLVKSKTQNIAQIVCRRGWSA